MITEYVKGKPYFSAVKGKKLQFPYLNKNIKCDALIVGAGIDGAICNYYFSQAKIDCVLIDKARVGYENTSCATSLLEYQLDDHANDLTKYFTKQQIVDVYNVGLSALNDIGILIKKFGNKCHYSKRDTLIYSLNKKDFEEIKREYLFRKSNNFDVNFITKENNPYEFNFEVGLLAKNGGAEFNSYLFTKQLIENRHKKFSKVFEHTEATEIIKLENGFKVITNYGIEICCKKIICATGYNTKLFTEQKLCDKFVSYTIVTQPLKNINLSNALLQDNADPYHYIRLSHDNRLIVGGEDIPFKNDTIKENVAQKKYLALFDYAKKLFPKLANKMKIEYQFCGAFSSTSNNLALIGESLNDKNIWYCLGYGANGIVYSIYGAQMLLNLYFNKPNKNENLFSPKRDLP